MSFEPRRARTSPSVFVVRDERSATDRLADAALFFDAGDIEAALHGYLEALRAALDEDDAHLAGAALDGAFAALDVPPGVDAFVRARAAIDAGIADDAGRAWDALCAAGGRNVHDAAACAAALRWEQA